MHLHHGAGDVTARVAIKGEIAPGGTAIAQLVTDDAVAALHGDRFVIRDQSALRTLGGGRVIDPFAPRRSRDRALRLAELQAIETDDAASALAALRTAATDGIDMVWFARVFRIGEERLAAMAAAAGLRIVVVDAAVRVVVAFHANSPQAAGADLGALRSQCAPRLPAAAFDALLREEPRIAIAGSTVRLRAHVATDNPGDRTMWARVQPPMQAAGFNGLTIAELAAAARVKEAELKDFLFRKAKTGEGSRASLPSRSRRRSRCPRAVSPRRSCVIAPESAAIA